MWVRDDELAGAAWLEWRVNAGYDGRAPDELPLRPPAWFVREELGYAFEHGPSLTWTCRTLAKTNRAAVRRLGREAPRRVTYPIDFKQGRPRAA